MGLGKGKQGWIWQGIPESRMTVKEMKAGDRVIFADIDGYIYKGSIRLKEVRCGKKNCKKCPHKIYAYARYRDGKTVKEKYLGVAR